jgi:predicted nuclease with RNAse H fold
MREGLRPDALEITADLWAGVDVGGRRKGFHAAVVGRSSLAGGPKQFPSPQALLEWLGAFSPKVVAVDSPFSPARDGDLSRDGEKLLAMEICGIRYTPDRATLLSSSYYEWILRGFELYSALSSTGWRVIECFPTASWTCWEGARQGQSRSAWSIAGLASLQLGGLPRRTNQDERDAIAAAVTARDFADGKTTLFGDIVVPLARNAKVQRRPQALNNPGVASRDCRCGCGGRTRGRFMPGHDAKLRSRLLKAIRGSDHTEAEAARAEFAALGW